MNRLLFILCILSASPVQGAELPRIGIFSLETANLNQELSTSGIDILATALSDLGIANVVTTHELNAMIQAQKIQDAMGCDDILCLAEIGAAAGIEKLISGSLALSSGTLIVNLQLVNIKYANVENRVTLNWSGSMSHFANVLGCAIELLVLTREERSPGLLHVASTPSGAQWDVNGEPKQFESNTDVQIPVGVHALRVREDGYKTFKQQVVVRSKKRSLITTDLEAKASRLIGIGFMLGSLTPLTDSYGLTVTGGTADLVYWHQLGRWSFVPRVGLRRDLAFEENRMYLEWVADIGVQFILWDDTIAPFIGVGGGGRQLTTKGPKTFQLGTVIRTTHTTTVREEQFWLAGYLRLGVEFFRDRAVHVVAALDYNVGYRSEDEQTHSLQSTLGIVF